ncbi:MAG TPA: NAD-dependent epimerase/dehydratase family protein [Anaerolineaceae bacterium]|nr:NAD-dependent epimerase/dehydratase family protein [Anaerolineaceae bacterium]
MQTFIVGGTGFLGYYTVRELLSRGHTVATIALPPAPPEGVLPNSVKVTLANLNTMPDEDVLKMLSGVEGLIFAAGVDDRIVPKSPAWDFFYQGNVVPTRRITRLAKEAGVRRMVIFSSYFVAFNRMWPELKMAEVHPYVRSRIAQIEAAKQEAGDDLSVSFLLLPYIFGSTPGRVPLWKPLIAYLNSALPVVFYPKGGCAMVSAREVACAAVRALEAGENAAEYEIASDNLSWHEWLTRLMTLLGKQKPIWTVPDWMVRLGARLVTAMHHRKGKESGLDLVEYIKVQTRMGFLDTEKTRKALGYAKGDLDLALEETVKACQ